MVPGAIAHHAERQPAVTAHQVQPSGDADPIVGAGTGRQFAAGTGQIRRRVVGVEPVLERVVSVGLQGVELGATTVDLTPDIAWRIGLLRWDIHGGTGRNGVSRFSLRHFGTLTSDKCRSQFAMQARYVPRAHLSPFPPPG